MEKLNRLAEVMLEKDIKVKDLAAKLGTSSSMVSNWKRNQNQPLLKRLYQIAKVLEIEPAELLVKTNQ